MVITVLGVRAVVYASMVNEVLLPRRRSRRWPGRCPVGCRARDGGEPFWSPPVPPPGSVNGRHLPLKKSKISIKAASEASKVICSGRIDVLLYPR